MDDEEQEEYSVPLQDQRIWGAGLKRKKITFVPAGSTNTNDPKSQSGGESASSKYLSIVLKRSPARFTSPETVTPRETQDNSTTRALDRISTTFADANSICAVCKAPLQETPRINSLDVSYCQGEELTQLKLSRHESSIAHQFCLAHVNPPSALDRSRQGAKYLSAYGWDPDARLGLGATGEGILAPVKGRVKNDTMGIGVETKSVSNSTAEVQGPRPHARGQGRTSRWMQVKSGSEQQRTGRRLSGCVQ